MRFPFVVSVHDVAPATAELVADWVADLDDRELPATPLVVPGPYDGGPALPSAPGLVDFLHAAANRGHELALHGFRHEGAPAARRGGGP